MRTIFLALLTTLFVSAMPLQAAYALADDADKVQSETNKQTCQTRETAFTPENRKEVQDQNGDIIELEGIQASAFQSRVEDLVANKAPFTSDYVLAVKPNAEVDTVYNVGFFVNGCFKAMLQIPPAIFSTLQGPKTVPLGERVD